MSDNEKAILSIGEKMRARRKELGLSMDEVGKAIGVTATQVFKYEQGKSKIDCMKMIEVADFLSVTPGYFFEKSYDELTVHFKKITNILMQKAIVTLCKNVSEIKELTLG